MHFLVRSRPLLLTAILFLFFLQLLSDLVETSYAFGLHAIAPTWEGAAVLVLFAPLVLLLPGFTSSRLSFTALALVVLAARVTEAFLTLHAKLLAAGLGVAASIVLFVLSVAGIPGRRVQLSTLLQGLTLGLAWSILLRMAGSGLDVSASGSFQAIGWALALLAGVLVLEQPAPAVGKEDPPSVPVGVLTLVPPMIGIAGCVAAVHFAFMSPAVIARWTGTEPRWITLAAAAVIVPFGFLAARRGTFELRNPVTTLWNAAFVASLVATILLHQESFPETAAGFPLQQHAGSPAHTAALVLMLLTFPVVLVDLSLFIIRITAMKPPVRSAAKAFLIAAIFWVLLILGQIFTTVYDYVPVVGGFFRNRFWLVFLLAGLAMALPVLRGSRAFSLPALQDELRLNRRFRSMLAVTGGLILVAFFLRHGGAATGIREARSLRVLTYNIQQGYSGDGEKNVPGQLRVLREADADIIGLEESDAARIAGGNSDLPGFFGASLNMYSYYGPKTVNGTFGIALLSRLPIIHPRTLFLYSRGEQAAVIEAQIEVEGKRLYVYVTHLGNGGPAEQLEEILAIAGTRENAILMGDFNFDPASEQYRRAASVLGDAWLLRWPAGSDNHGVKPDDRIDHIFVSRGLLVVDAKYLESPDSDHPAMEAVISSP